MNELLAVSDFEPSPITILNSDNTEMLRIERDGFYVRGVKVPTEDEPTLVYNAFKDFLISQGLIK